MDRDGTLYITDRLKELIKVKGYQVICFIVCFIVCYFSFLCIGMRDDWKSYDFRTLFCQMRRKIIVNIHIVCTCTDFEV